MENTAAFALLKFGALWMHTFVNVVFCGGPNWFLGLKICPCELTTFVSIKVNLKRACHS